MFETVFNVRYKLESMQHISSLLVQSTQQKRLQYVMWPFSVYNVNLTKLDKT